MNIKTPPACSWQAGGEWTTLVTDLRDFLDVDELAHPPSVVELHHARHFGEQRIVLAPADVQARLDLGAALANDDRPAGDQLAAENLYTEPLRVGIAPVSGTA